MPYRKIAASLLLLVAGLFLLAVAPTAGLAQADTLRPLVDALGEGKFAEREKAIEALAASGDLRAAPILEALGDRRLYVRKSDKAVVIAERDGKVYRISDAISGESLGEAGRRAVSRIKINNKLRGAISAAVGALRLQNPDPGARRDAAAAVFNSGDPSAIGALDAALAKETDDRIRRLMQQARAAAILNSDASVEEKAAAIAIIADRGDRDAMSILITVSREKEGALKTAADDAMRVIERELAVWGAIQNVWHGLSLGSVLLLAAIGLAITFGVMGVINMAHGEMVMIGAYTTYVVQEVIRNNAPGLFDVSLLIALPLAFLIAGAIGVAIERGIVRWLYGRPLETLLATWGLSLVLQQAVRSVFGPTNQEVGAPSWMAGAFELGNLTITYGRLWIIVFAIGVFAALVLSLKYTPFGLQMRAVSQNRAMASAMGIRTPWIDAMTFGLGSGIAGIAGVALSQIDNVSPNLGQSYIVDSFLVVVFGGVGNLWGTLVGAMTLGVANKFLEPYAGAVLGKIIVLVFIILFIQRRPRGLFALKGRAVEQ